MYTKGQKRQPGKYVPVSLEDLEKDGYEQILLTHAPTKDDENVTTFVVKHPHNSHMSTVVLLERTYLLSYTEPDNHGHQQRTEFHGNIYINQPGFSLQNMMSEITMNFETCAIHDKPSAWLPWYSRLYAKSLQSSIRASGRAFATHHGTVYLDSHYRRRINGASVRELSLIHISEPTRPY